MHLFERDGSLKDLSVLRCLATAQKDQPAETRTMIVRLLYLDPVDADYSSVLVSQHIDPRGDCQ
jgi:hypothetical protein